MEDTDYFAGYTLLDHCSNEHHLLVEAIRALVRRRNCSVKRMLDIGAGNGRLFGLAETKLEYLEFVEPSPLQFELCCVAAAKSAKHYLGHETEVLQLGANIGDQFDVILLSHLLYHIATADWYDLLQLLMPRLSASGFLAVVLWNAESEAYKFTHAAEPKRDFALAETFKTELQKYIDLHGLRWRFESSSIRPYIRLRTERGHQVLWQFLTKCSSDMVHEAAGMKTNVLGDMVVNISNDQDLICIYPS